MHRELLDCASGAVVCVEEDGVYAAECFCIVDFAVKALERYAVSGATVALAEPEVEALAQRVVVQESAAAEFDEYDAIGVSCVAQYEARASVREVRDEASEGYAAGAGMCVVQVLCPCQLICNCKCSKGSTGEYRVSNDVLVFPLQKVAVKQQGCD